MFRQLGAPELIIILAVLFLLFGAKRLPDLSRSLGRSMRIFKSEVKEMRDDDSTGTSTPPTTPPATPRPIEGTVHRGDETPRQPVPEAEHRDTP